MPGKHRRGTDGVTESGRKGLFPLSLSVSLCLSLALSLFFSGDGGGGGVLRTASTQHGAAARYGRAELISLPRVRRLRHLCLLGERSKGEEGWLAGASNLRPTGLLSGSVVCFFTGFSDVAATFSPRSSFSKAPLLLFMAARVTFAAAKKSAENIARME